MNDDKAKQKGQTAEDLERETGFPPLPKDHPLYKAGYVVGGRKLKGKKRSKQ